MSPSLKEPEQKDSDVNAKQMSDPFNQNHEDFDLNKININTL